MAWQCLENPMDRWAGWATIHRVTKSWTRLKWQHARMHARGSITHLDPFCVILSSFAVEDLEATDPGQCFWFSWKDILFCVSEVLSLPMGSNRKLLAVPPWSVSGLLCTPLGRVQESSWRVLLSSRIAPLKTKERDILGGPLVKNPPCNARDVSSVLDQGTKIPHVKGQPHLSPQWKIPLDAVKTPCAATKTQCSQINKYF